MYVPSSLTLNSGLDAVLVVTSVPSFSTVHWNAEPLVELFTVLMVIELPQSGTESAKSALITVGRITMLSTMVSRHAGPLEAINCTL